MRRYSYLFFSLLLAFTFAACDSADEDGNGDGNGNGNGGSLIGESNVTITGDIESSFSGSAIFINSDDNDGDFTIALFEGTLDFEGTFEQFTLPIDRVVGFAYEGDRPAEGDYQISSLPTESIFEGVYIHESDPGSFALATSGTLTITSSSSDRLVGSFRFTGPVFTDTGTQDTATVEGTFDADLVEESDFTESP
jgi:hypothetical protein